jgi:hypothetical protein
VVAVSVVTLICHFRIDVKKALSGAMNLIAV